MFEINLLGNGGMMPLPHRFLTSMYLQYKGSSILVDCGEGTQIALQTKNLGVKSLDLMLITHLHGDHIIGIPGVLLLAANQGRTAPMTIVGPTGIRDVVSGLLMAAQFLPFEVQCIEINQEEYTMNFNELTIQAFLVDHSVECLGYSIELPRAGKFDVKKAKELNIDMRFWNKLQAGEVVEIDGNTYSPDMVLGPKRRGLKVTYVTDSRPTDSIVNHARKSDLFICEGMYGDNNMQEKAIQKKHMTFAEAAMLAKQADVDELWLTHYSPSLTNPSEFLHNATTIFENTYAFSQGNTVSLNFKK